MVFDFSRLFFFFQAEDGIRDAQESRGLGDVYKRQVLLLLALEFAQEGHEVPELLRLLFAQLRE